MCVFHLWFVFSYFYHSNVFFSGGKYNKKALLLLYFWFGGLLHILCDGTGQRCDRQAVFGGGELVVLNGKISSFAITGKFL